MKTNIKRDHGGGLDAAIAEYGGQKENWVDLSTGINPVPYPVAGIEQLGWQTLPDQDANAELLEAARQFWKIPAGVTLIAAPGLSSLITQLPEALDGQSALIPGPTYNEYAASFSAAGWAEAPQGADAMIAVHPNNPDGRLWDAASFPNSLTIIDESFCDTTPDQSHVNLTTDPTRIVLKSFGKFWGLAGLRLGFAIGNELIISRLAAMLGPWPVSGPALAIGTRALNDLEWATQTRARLTADTKRLDQLLTSKGAEVVGGTTLFRLYHVDNATQWQTRLAKSRIWSRIFPYSENWLRLGLPGPKDWDQLERVV